MSTTIAVCIASYNMARFLPDVLHSLALQTFTDFTVYVAYNGSTDDTLTVLQNYQTFLPLKIASYDSRKGVGRNKHDAVALALQDNPLYIQMIDADDKVAPTFLETVVRRMEQGDIDWCVCDGQLFGERTGHIHGVMESKEMLLLRNGWNSWGTFKADLLRQHNYDPNVTACEDWDLWLRLTYAGFKGDVIRKDLYYRRWHKKSLTNTEDLTQEVTAQPTIERIKKELQKNAWQEAQIWEHDWWSQGGFINSLFEEEKQLTYATKMGLKWQHNGKTPYTLDLQGKKVLDLGGGPCSLLLKAVDIPSDYVSRTVVDPLEVPAWVANRYKSARIELVQCPAERFTRAGYDEVWLYNVLQHVQDPHRICTNALKLGKLVRIFEWLDMPVVPGHLHTLQKDTLDEWLGGVGRAEQFNTAALQGLAYYGIFMGGKE